MSSNLFLDHHISAHKGVNKMMDLYLTNEEAKLIGNIALRFIEQNPELEQEQMQLLKSALEKIFIKK